GRSGRRLVAALVLFLAAGGAAAAAVVLDRPPPADPGAARAAAAEARTITEQALEAQSRGLEMRAAAAARGGRLSAGLDSGINARSFQDLFETEDWWGAFRNEFPFTALVTGKQLMAHLGPEPADLAGSALVAAARQNKLASGPLAADSRAYLA